MNFFFLTESEKKNVNPVGTVFNRNWMLV